MASSVFGCEKKEISEEEEVVENLGPFGDIRDFGAVPDGKTLCTKAIQQAIDSCSQIGGGEVKVPEGTFLSGTIYLKNNVFLNLEKGAVLLGSTDINDYSPKGLIRAVKQINIGIIGQGVIDGQGFAFWEYKKSNVRVVGMSPARNFAHKTERSEIMIQLEDCHPVTIKDVTLRNSEAWTVHLLGCDDVTVERVTIRNPQHGPNTDGIDINGCRQVLISHCDIYTGDDAICLKNKDPKYWDRCCEDIVVTDCTITNSCNAFKIGTETNGDFKNIVFKNSVIKAGDPSSEYSIIAAAQLTSLNYDNILCSQSGISIETVDGSNVSDVRISNIKMEVRVPIFIRLGNRGREGGVMIPNSVPGSLKDVVITNIEAVNASTTSSITGLPGYNVENVKIDNIKINTRGGGDAELAQKKLAELEKNYPEAVMWGHLPASGLYIRHAKDIEIRNVSFMVDGTDMRPLMIFDDVAGLSVNNFKTNDFHRGESIIDYTNVRDANLVNSDFTGCNIPKWLSFAGNETNNIQVLFPEATDPESRITIDGSVSEGSVKIN